MTPIRLPPPLWIDTLTALQKSADDLKRQSRVAVDTESNSLYAYHERVCLIQFSTLEVDYLVDPLALNDLSPLAPFFANSAIEKVFHAAEYDLICLKRDFGFSVANLFDTMQAARILGYRQVGLDAMLALKLGVKVDKRFQKADWARRPLPADFLNYARLDTHYLLELGNLLKDELEAGGRRELAVEEFLRLSQSNGNPRNEIPTWQRINGAQKLNERQQTILHELCLWRENMAQGLDRPTFKVMDDKRLVILAQSVPETIDDLKTLGLTLRQIQLYGNELLQAIKRGQRATPVRRQYPSRPDETFLIRMDTLSDWRKHAAEKMGVESDIILPRPFLHAVAEKNPRTVQELSGLMPQSPWRLERFGPEILKVLAATPARRVRPGVKNTK